MRFLAAALCAVSIMFFQTPAVHATPVTVAISSTLAMFSTEDEAQAHCPRDVVVWGNIPTQIFHEKGMRWYGRTRHGAFMCRREAIAAGYRDTRNGQ